MNEGTERTEWEAFRRAWREWAARPPAVSPEDASRRVRARIEPRSERRSGRRWVAVAAVVLAALSLGWWFAAGIPDASPPSPQVADTTAPIDEGVVLLWLNPETPLYMTFAPPRRSNDKGES